MSRIVKAHLVNDSTGTKVVALIIPQLCQWLPPNPSSDDIELHANIIAMNVQQSFVGIINESSEFKDDEID